MIVIKTPVKQRRSENNPAEEYRSLARVLAKKIEALTCECRFEHDNSVHIRTMGLTLETLTALVKTPDHDSRTMHTPDILEDAHGFTYQSVRSCDLDRICDK